ncbi:transmembrane GTPase fzo1 [Lactarius quietus]|nr:transmembrane GTPase fzo1 [Lactarius quietus]
MAGTEEVTGPLRGAQQAFVEQKVRILGGLDATKNLLSDIRVFTKDSWTIRYPKLSTKAEEVGSSPKRRGVRRSLSFMDDPSSETDVILGRGIRRSLTLAAITDAQENEGDESPSDLDVGGRLIPESEVLDFQVVRIDLNIGHLGSSAAAGALVSQLEKVSIANLVDERMAASSQHIDRLRVRVEDTSSKVLVTGDLNAGKSTFVNALLRRTVMPIDQQPCTTVFCEVHDFSENNNVEEVHIIKDAAAYDIGDESTYKRADIDALNHIMEDEERPSILKLYLNDSRPLNQSLLNNGVVDISLIDSPGLNRDSVKTTALFARQEQIDVVVFVVSAENHLTESARNFLKNASNEKAYVFIVVNKFAQIKNKEKCRRMVLEQIKELSPRTYEDANDLVHFVDSLVGKDDPSFEELEASLRSFVLVKRAKSKLNPASTYLSNLLSDIELLVGANAIVAQAEILHAKGDLDAARPVLERMKNSREALEEALEAVEEQGASSANSKTQRMLTDALDRVGQGLPGVVLVQMPSYPGLLNLWDYARDVRKTLITSLDMAVKLAEDEARVITSAGVQEVLTLGDEYLPKGVERSRRVFMPEAMFSTRRTRDGKRRVRSNSAVVAGGTLGLGIGFATREEMLEPTFLDLLDAPYHLWIYLCDGKEAEDEEKAKSAIGIVSVAVATVTMIGGQSLGLRGFVEAVMHVTNILADENTRKWGAPVLGALAAGAAAYVILELPNSVPRAVGRRIRHSLVEPVGGPRPQEEHFVYFHAARVARETRKVLRLVSWDVKQRFRVTFEERSHEVRVAEETEGRAICAKEFFAVVGQRTAEIRDHAGLVSLS